MKQSMRPNSCLTSSTSFLMASYSATSTLYALTLVPYFFARSAARSSMPSAERYCSARSPPASAIPSAAAHPRPPEPPVTIVTLPFMLKRARIESGSEGTGRGKGPSDGWDLWAAKGGGSAAESFLENARTRTHMLFEGGGAAGGRRGARSAMTTGEGGRGARGGLQTHVGLRREDLEGCRDRE